MAVSTHIWAVCFFFTLSDPSDSPGFSAAFLLEETSQTYCAYYKYKSTSYYNYYYGTKYRSKLTTTDKYCTTSCCVDDCCPEYTYTYYYYYYYHNTITSGAIVGIVLGSLIGLAVLISIVVAFCIGCRRQQSQPGQTVSASGHNVHYIHTSQSSVPGQVVVGGTYPQYPYGVQTQGYRYPPAVVRSSVVTVNESPSTEGRTNTGFKPDTAAPPPPYSSIQ